MTIMDHLSMITTVITVPGRYTDPCTDHVEPTGRSSQVNTLKVGVSGADSGELSVWR